MIIRVAYLADADDVRFVTGAGSPDAARIETGVYEDRTGWSIPGGAAERHLRDVRRGFFVFDGIWTEAEAMLFSEQWQYELTRVEVSDDFAISRGLGPIRDTESVT